ncbi:hypothetical protein PP568_13250 [Mycobacteroides abscessus]|uniref:Scaffolding protein n=1 Tax=Mycobacteroides abscessus subsp. abscessus TaxID=1185650 RepID=A0AB38D552_9MYCO|nr:hypothetical protein [Mycobacteroides abscessus]QSM03255.1 scaffolding protein [Mycobacterium phage prophi102-2]QSM04027.1 scaffolding protein [Mycobacterium phage prophiGD54-1]MBE5420149.1 hypothetical protein [Mycobacteroides abscessus]MBE5455152.1 hypothetical protein [Mycobacteroides abscessus]MBN7296751.1 hypothetical protein [Mycobacteroides abscessus subsp. abscessus]
MSDLPIHPFTHVQAIGFTSRGPVWPVMGGSGDGDEDGAGAESGAQSGQGASHGGSDKGFPADTPVAQMTDAQQAAYWKHYSREHEGKAKAFTTLGVTPEQIQQLQERNAELEKAQLNASELALKEATDKAAADARAATEADWKPKLLASQLKSAASQVLSGDQLTEWLDSVDPGKFVGDNGEIDESKVMGKLTAIFGQKKEQQQQQPFWGQHSTGHQSADKPGTAGRAAAAKRFGSKT